MWARITKAWKPISGILSAFILVTVVIAAWKGLPSPPLLASDVEVAIEVAAAIKPVIDRAASHEPKLIELAGSVDVLKKGQNAQEHATLLILLSGKDNQLYQVQQQTSTAASKAREATLKREIEALNRSIIRVECKIQTGRDC